MGAADSRRSRAYLRSTVQNQLAAKLAVADRVSAEGAPLKFGLHPTGNGRLEHVEQLAVVVDTRIEDIEQASEIGRHCQFRRASKLRAMSKSKAFMSKALIGRSLAMNAFDLGLFSAVSL